MINIHTNARDWRNAAAFVITIKGNKSLELMQIWYDWIITNLRWERERVCGLECNKALKFQSNFKSSSSKQQPTQIISTKIKKQSQIQRYRLMTKNLFFQAMDIFWLLSSFDQLYKLQNIISFRPYLMHSNNV